MFAHVFNAGVRALAASLILGGILIYAVGGFDSPDVRPLGGVIVAGFFMFWIVFVFLFRKRLPKADSRRQDRGPDESPHLAFRVRRRREEDGGDHGGEIGEGGGGGDGGGGD